MQDAIKSIVPPEYEFDTDRQEWLEKYNDNVTYVFKIASGNRKKVYSLEDWLDTLNIELLGNHKLRYDDSSMKPIMSTGRIATGEPRGVVINMLEQDAENFDKDLLIFLLMQEGDRFTVDRVNNNEIRREQEAAQEKLLNSLFTFE